MEVRRCHREEEVVVVSHMAVVGHISDLVDIDAEAVVVSLDPDKDARSKVPDEATVDAAIDALDD